MNWGRTRIHTQVKLLFGFCSRNCSICIENVRFCSHVSYRRAGVDQELLRHPGGEPAAGARIGESSR